MQLSAVCFFGYDTAVISGTVESLQSFFIDPYNLSETAANSRLGLIIAALLFLISAFGSAMPEIFIRPIGEGDHTFIWNFVAYRVIGGIGVGLASMMAPMYIAEIAPAHNRGKLVSLNQFAIILGILVS